MRIRILLSLAVLIALTFSYAVRAQVADPLPSPVDKRGLLVQVKDVVRLPQTRGLLPPEADVNPAGWAPLYPS
jgi:hypothetical protein